DGNNNGYERDSEGRYVLDCAKPRDEIWFDYVADTGDGWNSTYAIAYHLTQPSLDLNAHAPEDGKTKRGEILIFGGDQVYPSADRATYQKRLVVPYQSALAKSKPPQPFLFATPGNHDWYDSLVAFTRLFCATDPFAGWLTRQTRSYFALRLPHKWWF